MSDPCEQGDAAALIDPTRPAHDLVEIREDGSALRNDGTELAPAAKNRWYVLATVYGEQGENWFDVDRELHVKNRRVWNGVMCAGMSAEEKAKLAERLELDAAELELTEEDKAALAARFEAAFPELDEDGRVPAPSEWIDFSKTHLSNDVVLEKCVFSGHAHFSDATFSGAAFFSAAIFSGHADFSDATFSGDAYFSAAIFSGAAFFSDAIFSGHADFSAAIFSWVAVFNDATFSGDADFSAATFSGDAYFNAATFSGVAVFNDATFSGVAYFSAAIFSGDASFNAATFSWGADFSDGAFRFATNFEDARFVRRVPMFYQREMHQNTTFTTDEDHWPKITDENAKEGKQAYTRLRQVMNQLQKPDEEHFFFRQEMRCKAVLETSPINRALYAGFRALSDYGHSISRPFWAMLIIWGASALIYGAVFYVMCIVWGAHCHAPPPPFGFSFANLFSFLGLGRLLHGEVYATLPGPLQALAGFQTVAGVVLVFLLGLGLRTHFRLK